MSFEMSDNPQIAIIGSSPCGPTLAAHFDAARIDFGIFGRPEYSRRRFMPRGMSLLPKGWAFDHCDPTAVLQPAVPLADLDPRMR